MPPDPLAGFKGPTSKGRGGEGTGGQGKGRGREGEGGEGQSGSPTHYFRLKSCTGISDHCRGMVRFADCCIQIAGESDDLKSTGTRPRYKPQISSLMPNLMSPS